MVKLLSSILILISLLASAQLSKTIYKQIGGKTVYSIESKNVFMVTSGFMIDADGSPKAYHQDNKKALDYLGNAGKPGNWWAIATDNKKSNGNPIIQSANDPAPGYYVSMTSLQDKSKNYRDPTKYVNSETIPYIAVPPKFSADFQLGDIALVVNKKNNKRCFAIFADTGPANKIGEGSIYLAEQLGLKSSPKNGGASADIVYILIKNSGRKQVLSHEEIQAIGRSKLSEEDIAELLQ
jgi:Fungal chitosanase of glycosyl hydrolase group 75